MRGEWCAVKPMPKSHSHVHDRSYFGEFDAEPVIDWLNTKTRPAGDPVETLLKLNSRLPIEAREHNVRDYLSRIVRRSKVAVAPVLISAARDKWRIDWRLVGNMHPLQGLALIKLLHLADRGLIGRLRKCTSGECAKWFYARFEHQRFHSARCQQETFRSDPEWKKQRAEYMKELRQTKKLREQKWLRPPKIKRKGKR
jgi:hypothetical protein